MDALNIMLKLRFDYFQDSRTFKHGFDQSFSSYFCLSIKLKLIYAAP